MNLSHTPGRPGSTATDGRPTSWSRLVLVVALATAGFCAALYGAGGLSPGSGKNTEARVEITESPSSSEDAGKDPDHVPPHDPDPSAPEGSPTGEGTVTATPKGTPTTGHSSAAPLRTRRADQRPVRPSTSSTSRSRTTAPEPTPEPTKVNPPPTSVDTSELGRVTFPSNTPRSNASDWGKAWDLCTATYAGTHSVHYVGAKELPTHDYEVTWGCSSST